MKAYYNKKSAGSGIYKIVNTSNGRIYIGKAKVFRQRFYEHRRKLKAGTHKNKFLQHDFNKCGENVFEFHVLEVIAEHEDRNKAEEKWIAQFYDKQKQCYNFQKKSNALPRRVHSNDPDITKKILSKKSKEMWKDPKIRKKILKRKNEAMKTPEYKKALKEGLERAWDDEERREKTSKRLKKEHASGSRQDAVETLKKHQPKGRKTFKKRMKEDGEFKKKYQEIGRKNIAKWNAEQPKKEYPPLVSPDGKEYTVCGVPTFCKEHGLTKQLLYNVLNGKSKSHKGWKLK